MSVVSDERLVELVIAHDCRADNMRGRHGDTESGLVYRDTAVLLRELQHRRTSSAGSDCATGKAPVDEQQYDYEDRHACWFNSYMLLVSKLKLDVDYEPADTFPERVEKALGDKFSKAAEAK